MPENNDLIKEQVRYISHEIKNQLSIEDVYCEIIRKHLEKSNIENESIERALNCIQQSTKLIGNALLDLKSFTNITPEKIPINQLVEESIELAKVYAYEKKITIVQNLNNDTIVNIDKNKLEACLVNLIKNAIEAIEEIGIVKIETGISDNQFKITVANNGTPIPPQEQNRIFNDGFTTKKNGSGIGLYLCKENLKAQGANLTLLKSDNEETVFEISLNLQK